MNQDDIVGAVMTATRAKVADMGPKESYDISIHIEGEARAWLHGALADDGMRPAMETALCAGWLRMIDDEKVPLEAIDLYCGLGLPRMYRQRDFWAARTKPA